MNLVREHIDFKRGLDPKQAMDIGFWATAKNWSMDKKYEYFYSKFMPKYQWLINSNPIIEKHVPGEMIVGFPLKHMKDEDSLKYAEEFEEWFKKEMPIFNFQEVRKRNNENWYYLRFDIKEK